jgi:hypothetical protein
MSQPADFAETDTARLEAQVRGWLRGRMSCFKIQRAATGLILRGHSQTYYVKQLAQHAIMEACPLPILANEIKVSLATATCACDRE